MSSIAELYAMGSQIVGELGKLLIEEIPLDTTPPGYGRAPYHGFDKTSRLASETSKCVDEVVFAPPQVQLKPLDPTQLNLGGEPRFEEQSSRGDSSHGYRNDDQFAEFGDEPELPRRFRNDDDASSFPASPSSYLPQTASYQDTSGRSMVVLSADGQELPSSSTAPPQLSPAAQYRYSFTGPSETTTATARDGHEDGYGDLVPPGEGALPSGGVSTISRGPNAAREELDDGYGNLIPPGEGPASDADQDGSLSGYSRHARTDRPRIGGPRLSLGLGPTVGGGDFAATSAASTNTYGGTNSSSPPPMNNRRSLSIEQESYLPYDAPSPSEPAPTSAFPARRSSDQSFASELQPPSAPFAQPTTKEGQSPITEQETESYVDAPSRPGSSGTGGGRLSGDGSNGRSPRCTAVLFSVSKSLTWTLLFQRIPLRFLVLRITPCLLRRQPPPPPRLPPASTRATHLLSRRRAITNSPLPPLSERLSARWTRSRSLQLREARQVTQAQVPGRSDRSPVTADRGRSTPVRASLLTSTVCLLLFQPTEICLFFDC